MKKTSKYARKRAHNQFDPKALARLQNPIASAMITQSFEQRMQRLQTAVALHTYTGNDARAICDLLGSASYIAMHGAAANGWSDTPDARILLGTANALAELGEKPEDLEIHRPTIMAGVQAVERLMSNIHPLDLALAQMYMEQSIVPRGGVTVEDLHDLRAACQPPQPDTTGPEHAIRKGVAAANAAHQRRQKRVHAAST